MSGGPDEEPIEISILMGDLVKQLSTVVAELKKLFRTNTLNSFLQ
jgi:hypothetical protein